MDKLSYYVLSISYDNYLLRDGGVPKYIEEQQSALRLLDIGYIHIAPIRKISLSNEKYILHDLYTVVINGNYQGIYTEKQLFNSLQTIQKEGKKLIGIFLHHCSKVNMDFLDFLLQWLAEIPVFFYIHDYYSVCPNFLMLKNDSVFCGKGKRSEEKCHECSYYTSGMKQHNAVETFLNKYCNRIVPVSPSNITKEIWQNTFSQYKDKIKVVPHLIWKEQYKENMYFLTEKIRIAYVGSALTHKGWDVWKNLYKTFDQNQNSYELYTFGQNTPRCANTTQVNVSITMEEKESMQAQLRKYNIDCVILWSNLPETYSYAYFESYAANTFILTFEDSGNIAYMVNKVGNGIVLKDEEQLQKLLMNPQELKFRINNYYHSTVYGPLRFEKNYEIENLLEKKTYKFLDINRVTRNLYNNRIKCIIARILYRIKYRRMI